MSLNGAIQLPFTQDKFVDENGVLTPSSVNWFNQLFETINHIYKSGRDTLGAGATNTKIIYVIAAEPMTTALRDSMAGVTGGNIIYNTDTNTLQVYDGTNWADCN